MTREVYEEDPNVGTDFSVSFGSDFGTNLPTSEDGFTRASDWAGLLGIVLPTGSALYPDQAPKVLLGIPSITQVQRAPQASVLAVSSTVSTGVSEGSWTEYLSLVISTPGETSKWLVMPHVRVYCDTTEGLASARIEQDDTTTRWFSTKEEHQTTQRWVHHGMAIVECVDSTTIDVDVLLEDSDGTVEGASLTAIRLDVQGADYSYIATPHFTLSASGDGYVSGQITKHLSAGQYFVGMCYNHPSRLTGTTTKTKFQIRGHQGSTLYISPNRSNALYEHQVNHARSTVYKECLFTWNVITVGPSLAVTPGEVLFRPYTQTSGVDQTGENALLVVLKISDVYDFEFLEVTGATEPVDDSVFRTAVDLAVDTQASDYVFMAHARLGLSDLDAGPGDVALQMGGVTLSNSDHYRVRVLDPSYFYASGFGAIQTLPTSPNTNVLLYYTGYTSGEAAEVTDMRILLWRIFPGVVVVTDGYEFGGQLASRAKVVLPNGVKAFIRLLPPPPARSDAYYRTHAVIVGADGTESEIDDTHPYFGVIDQALKSASYTGRIMNDVELDEFEARTDTF